MKLWLHLPNNPSTSQFESLVRLAKTLNSGSRGRVIEGFRWGRPLYVYATSTVGSYDATAQTKVTNVATQLAKNDLKLNLTLAYGPDDSWSNWIANAGDRAKYAVPWTTGEQRGAYPPTEAWTACANTWIDQINRARAAYTSAGRNPDDVHGGLWNEPFGAVGGDWTTDLAYSDASTFAGFIGSVGATLRSNFPTMLLWGPTLGGYFSQTLPATDIANSKTSIDTITTSGIDLSWASGFAFNMYCPQKDRLTIGTKQIYNETRAKAIALLNYVKSRSWWRSDWKVSVHEFGYDSLLGGYSTHGLVFSHGNKTLDDLAAYEAYDGLGFEYVTKYGAAHDSAGIDADGATGNFGYVLYGTNDTNGGQWTQGVKRLCDYFGVARPANGQVDGAAYIDVNGNSVASGATAAGFTIPTGYATGASEPVLS